MDKVAHLITKENDILYVLGKQEVITNLLMASLLTVEQIAQVAGVSVAVAFVKKIQASLPRSLTIPVCL